MCQPDQFPPYPDPPEVRTPPPPPFVERRRTPRHPILVAAEALGLPDCPPSCKCRGQSAEER